MSVDRKDRVECKELKAGRIVADSVVVESGNGLYRIELVGGTDHVGLYLQNPETAAMIAIVSDGETLELSVHGNANREGPTRDVLVLSVAGGRPYLQMTKEDGTPLRLGPEDVEAILRGGKTGPDVSGVDGPPADGDTAGPGG